MIHGTGNVFLVISYIKGGEPAARLSFECVLRHNFVSVQQTDRIENVKIS